MIPPQHVVLIAVDGLRPEALTPETMPVLSRFEETLTVDLPIPLVLFGPGVPAHSQIAGPVSILDIAPTLAWRLGLDIPVQWQGHPLQQAFQHDR
jgi:hypothetical protein